MCRAKVISHVILRKSSNDTLVGYFFCQFDITTSLKAETILRSVIRQILNDTKIPRNIEDDLQSITQNASLDLVELGTLLHGLLSKQIALSKRTYIFIDALEECDKRERNIVFNVPSSAITASQSKLKVFLTGRDGIDDEVKCFHLPL